MVDRHVAMFYIVGFTYHDGIDVIHKLKFSINSVSSDAHPKKQISVALRIKKKDNA